jgi:hypothetical protein
VRADGKRHAAKFSAGESVHTFGCSTKAAPVYRADRRQSCAGLAPTVG